MLLILIKNGQQRICPFQNRSEITDTRIQHEIYFFFLLFLLQLDRPLSFLDYIY